MAVSAHAQYEFGQNTDSGQLANIPIRGINNTCIIYLLCK